MTAHRRTLKTQIIQLVAQEDTCTRSEGGGVLETLTYRLYPRPASRREHRDNQQEVYADLVDLAAEGSIQIDINPENPRQIYGLRSVTQPRPTLEEVTVPPPHWDPLMSEYRDLILIVLQRVPGHEIIDENGHARDRLHEVAGRPPHSTEKPRLMRVLKLMEDAGLIEREPARHGTRRIALPGGRPLPPREITRLEADMAGWRILSPLPGHLPAQDSPAEPLEGTSESTPEEGSMSKTSPVPSSMIVTELAPGARLSGPQAYQVLVLLVLHYRGRLDDPSGRAGLMALERAGFTHPSTPPKLTAALTMLHSKGLIGPEAVGGRRPTLYLTRDLTDEEISLLKSFEPLARMAVQMDGPVPDQPEAPTPPAMPVAPPRKFGENKADPELVERVYELCTRVFEAFKKQKVGENENHAIMRAKHLVTKEMGLSEEEYNEATHYLKNLLLVRHLRSADPTKRNGDQIWFVQRDSKVDRGKLEDLIRGGAMYPVKSKVAPPETTSATQQQSETKPKPKPATTKSTAAATTSVQTPAPATPPAQATPPPAQAPAPVKVAETEQDFTLVLDKTLIAELGDEDLEKLSRIVRRLAELSGKQAEGLSERDATIAQLTQQLNDLKEALEQQRQRADTAEQKLAAFNSPVRQEARAVIAEHSYLLED
jgi:hypothetical protein